MSNTTTVKLSTPLTTHKGTISEIVLKMPTARSFRLFGNPYLIHRDPVSQKPMPVIIDEAMLKFLADASGFDELTLDDLPAPDYDALRWTMFNMINGVMGGNEENPQK